MVSLKNAVFLFFVLGSVFFVCASARAHSIETDGAISTMIHANPDDNPIIGQPASLTFYITDRQKKFKAAECDCRLTIKLGEDIVLSTTTFDTIKNSPVFSYVFPQKGIFTIEFSANPLVKDGFQSFVFNYDMRVERTMEQVIAAKSSARRIYIVLGFFVLATILFIKRKKYV